MIEADLAMYDAKERGGDRIALPETGSARRAQAEARLSWLQWVREVLTAAPSSSTPRPSSTSPQATSAATS